MNELPPEIARKIRELQEAGDFMGATVLEQRHSLHEEGWDQIRRERFSVLGNKQSLLSWRGAGSVDADYVPLLRSYPFSSDPPLIATTPGGGGVVTHIFPLIEADTGFGANQYMAFGEMIPTSIASAFSDPFNFATVTQCAQSFINIGSMGPSTGPVIPREDDSNNTLGFGFGYYDFDGNMPIGSALSLNPYIQLRARLGAIPFWQLAYNVGGGSGTLETAVQVLPLAGGPGSPEYRRLQRMALIWEPNYGVAGRIIASIDGAFSKTVVLASGTKPDFSGAHQYGLTFFATSGSAVPDALTEIIVHNASVQQFPGGLPGTGP